MAGKQKKEKDLSTEEKIKEAARKVFISKGYAGTRTRDIAEESGLNLALINYYFRSKEKLFEIVMLEKIQKFLGVLQPVLNDTATSIDIKVQQVATNYIELLTANPDLPIFVLSEIRSNPGGMASNIRGKRLIADSFFAKQLLEKRPDINPVHFVISLLGLCIFPFIGRPLLQLGGNIGSSHFAQMMEERKMLIPKWVKAMLKAK